MPNIKSQNKKNAEVPKGNKKLVKKGIPLKIDTDDSKSDDCVPITPAKIQNAKKMLVSKSNPIVDENDSSDSNGDTNRKTLPNKAKPIQPVDDASSDDEIARTIVPPKKVQPKRGRPKKVLPKKLDTDTQPDEEIPPVNNIDRDSDSNHNPNSNPDPATLQQLDDIAPYNNSPIAHIFDTQIAKHHSPTEAQSILIKSFVADIILKHESAIYKKIVSSQVGTLKTLQTNEIKTQLLIFATTYLNSCYKSCILNDDRAIVRRFGQIQQVKHHSVLCIINMMLITLFLVHKLTDRSKFNIDTHMDYYNSIVINLSVSLHCVTLVHHIEHVCDIMDIELCNPDIPLLSMESMIQKYNDSR